MWFFHILLGHNVIRREAIEPDYSMGHIAVFQQDTFRRPGAHRECADCGKVW